jgi:hypothetical protein
MKMLLSTFALVLAFALPANAQLKLEISEGRVTLDAVNVPARQILSEWARIGGTKIVGSEKIVGGPLTLKLDDVPEKQALDIILRNVAGFMAAPRQASAAPGASTYDRILIMATSSAPAETVTNNPRGRTPNTMAGTQRRVPPRPPNLPPVGADDPPQDDQQPDDQTDNGASEPPVFTFPTPAGAQQGNPVFVPMPNNGQPGVAPVITLQPGTNGPAIYNFVPVEGAQPTQQPQTTPFGVVGAPAPGMIQVPQQAQPQPNVTPVRPVTRPPGV